MSLAIAFKGPEGIVLGADSRVTILHRQTSPGAEDLVVPATFDNATKLLRVRGLSHVGAVTFELGTIGEAEPRTAHSFLPELQAYLRPHSIAGEDKSRISTEDFAKRLSDFFLHRWSQVESSSSTPSDMFFLAGEFDEDEPYGRVYQFAIPSDPTPREQIPGEFGITWGG